MPTPKVTHSLQYTHTRQDKPQQDASQTRHPLSQVVNKSMETKSSADVLVLTYNHEEFILDCLRSIANQITDYKFRIIVSDDSSTDRTLELAREFADNYNGKITILTSSTNLGVNRNFAKLIKASTADYLAFCEGDDFWVDRYKLQYQIDLLTINPSASFSYTDFDRCMKHKDKWYFLKSSGESVGSPPASGLIFDRLLDSISIHLSTLVCRRELALHYLSSKLYDHSLHMADVPLILYLAANGEAVGIKKSTSVYRHHGNSITNKSLDSRKQIILEHYCIASKYETAFQTSVSARQNREIEFASRIADTAYAARDLFTFLCFTKKLDKKTIARLALMHLPLIHKVHMLQVQWRQTRDFIRSSEECCTALSE